MTKHTPGPWHVANGHIIYAPDGWAVANAVVRHNNTRRHPMPGEEGDANARLIASAPDLLKQLQIAADQICYLKPERYDDPEHEAHLNAMLDDIYAAIKAATTQGEQS